jgi:hypothetical protein
LDVSGFGSALGFGSGLGSDFGTATGAGVTEGDTAGLDVCAEESGAVVTAAGACWT